MSDPMIDRVKRRLAGMISRAVVEAVADDEGLQMLQVSGLDGELYDGVERFQDYGFAAHPHADAEAMLVAVGGTRSHGIVIAVADRRYRLRALAQGEVAIHDDQDQVIHLKRDGIRIESPFKVEIEAPTVDVTADSVTVTADSVALGGIGGAAVARVGDTVAGGVITSGSPKVKSA